jgi:hypothetical protein
LRLGQPVEERSINQAIGLSGWKLEETTDSAVVILLFEVLLILFPASQALQQ